MEPPPLARLPPRSETPKRGRPSTLSSEPPPLPISDGAMNEERTPPRETPRDTARASDVETESDDDRLAVQAASKLQPEPEPEPEPGPEPEPEPEPDELSEPSSEHANSTKDIENAEQVEGPDVTNEKPVEVSALLGKVGRQTSQLVKKRKRDTRSKRQERLDDMLKAPCRAAETFSADHELAMKMDDIFPKLVIKREEAEEEMKSRVVAKDDVVHGGFYILFYLIFFWVVTDQLDMRNRFELEGAIADYIGGEPWDEANHYTLEDLDSLEAIWTWLEDVFVPCLFVDPEWYNGDSFSPEEEGFMMQYNKLVGGFQLVQKRVIENDEECEPSPRFGDWAGDCYDEYYNSYRSEEPFGPPHDPEKYTFWAGDSREQAGFHVYFPLDRDFAIRQLRELKSDKFLDKQTRDLQIDFTVYNENKHLFCAVTIHIKQLNSGMIETEFDMDSISLEPYASSGKTVAVTPRMIFEVLIILYVVLQGYDELYEIKEAGVWDHFFGTGGFWNVVDALRIATFAVSITGYARIIFDPTGWNLQLPLPVGQIYVDFANLSEASEHYVLSCSFAIMLCLLSVMKYIRHSQAYGLLIITLQLAGPEIFRFMVMFSIVNLTFVVMGLIMFGNILEEFSTISRSFQTLMMMMTGEYGYEGIQEVSQVFAAMFYVLYLILVFFILVNMFLAIVFDAYAALQEVKDQLPSFPYRYSFMQEEVRELQRGKFGWVFACCSGRARAPAKDVFFLGTEDMLLLLEDPETLGAERPQREVARQEQKAEHFHHVQAERQFETVITYDDMVSGFGWGDIQVRWLLSQLGVPDDQALADSNAEMLPKQHQQALENVVQRQIEAGLKPVQKDVVEMRAQLEKQSKLLTQLLQQTEKPQESTIMSS